MARRIGKGQANWRSPAVGAAASRPPGASPGLTAGARPTGSARRRLPARGRGRGRDRPAPDRPER